MKFPQPPIHDAPIAGVLAWVQWFTQITKYFFVEGPNFPTLGTGWSNFGGSEEVAQYWIDNASGTVHIQGLVVNPGSPSSGSVIFTLPVGYRPDNNISITVGTANTAGSHTIGRCVIKSNGEVTYDFGSHKYYFELNGITFRAYQ